MTAPSLDAAIRDAEEAMRDYDACKGYEVDIYAMECVHALRSLLAALPAEGASARGGE